MKIPQSILYAYHHAQMVSLPCYIDQNSLAVLSFQLLSYYSTIYACLLQWTVVARLCFVCEAFCMHVP